MRSAGLAAARGAARLRGGAVLVPGGRGLVGRLAGAHGRAARRLLPRAAAPAGRRHRLRRELHQQLHRYIDWTLLTFTLRDVI